MTHDISKIWFSSTSQMLPACLSQTSPAAVARLLQENLNVSSWTPVLCPQASRLIAAYDEHVLVSNFKFGVLYQVTTNRKLAAN